MKADTKIPVKIKKHTILFSFSQCPPPLYILDGHREYSVSSVLQKNSGAAVKRLQPLNEFSILFFRIKISLSSLFVQVISLAVDDDDKRHILYIEFSQSLCSQIFICDQFCFLDTFCEQ